MTPSAATADLVIATCAKLRELGAVSFKGFGCEVHFAAPQPVELPKPEPRVEDPRKLSPEAEELRQRTLTLAGRAG